MSLPCSIRDEIRRVMAVVGHSKVFRKGQSTQKQIQEQLETMFHGSAESGVVSQVMQVVNGLAPFDALYDKRVDIITSSVCTNATTLVLKKELIQSDNIYIAGKHVTTKFLEQTSKNTKDLVKGRKIYNDSQSTQRNIRKALAVLKGLPEVHFVENEIQYKSGVSVDEVKAKVLDAMYTLLKGKPSVDDDDENDDDDDNCTTTNDSIEKPRPEGWFFHGWMSFLLFGPFVEKNQRLDLFEIGAHPNDTAPSSSRKASRKEDAHTKDVQRDNGVNNKGEPVQRGASLSSQICSATLEIKNKELEIKEKELAQTERDTMLFNMNYHLRNMLKRLELAMERASKYSPTFDENNYLWKVVMQQEDEISLHQKKIQSLIDESNLMDSNKKQKRSTKSAIPLYDSDSDGFENTE
jgi:hypothetical protein